VRGRLEQRQPAAVQQVPGLRGERHGQEDRVRAPQQLVQLDLDGAADRVRPPAGDQHPHAEAGGDAGDPAADVTRADDAGGAAGELEGAGGIREGRARARGGLGRAQPPHGCEQQRDGVLGDRGTGIAGGVADRDAALRTVLDVDVVDGRGGGDDEPQPRQPGQRRRVQLLRGGDQDPAGVPAPVGRRQRGQAPRPPVRPHQPAELRRPRLRQVGRVGQDQRLRPAGGHGPSPGATGPYPDATGSPLGGTGPSSGATGSPLGATGPSPGATGPSSGATGPPLGATGPSPGATGPYSGATGPPLGGTGPYSGGTGSPSALRRSR
jgi:hypothetical protein